jgi:hypothetical protein
MLRLCRRTTLWLFKAEEHRPMCDYSLHNVRSRPAKVEDKLVSTTFCNSITRGFAAVGQPNVAVCLLPGTEIAFEIEVECKREWGFLPNRRFAEKVARFRQIDTHKPNVHHDALEFPNGQIVLVNDLREGQQATVLQLPVLTRAASNAVKQSDSILAF